MNCFLAIKHLIENETNPKFEARNPKQYQMIKIQIL